MPLGDADYEAAVKARTKSPPEIVYKYMTMETAKAVIGNQTIRFQSPLNYNDPFDTQWDILWTVGTDDAKDYMRRLIVDALLDPATCPNDTDPSMLEGIVARHTEIMKLHPSQRREKEATDFAHAATQFTPHEAFCNKVTDLQQRMRIACFCERCESSLMWSHYADHHKGVLLGFRSDALENEFKRVLQPVAYATQLPKIVDHEMFFREALYGVRMRDGDWDTAAWALTKHIDWSYELEWRFVWNNRIHTDNDFEDYTFPSKALAEISFGCRTELGTSDSKRLRRKAEKINRNVRAFKMNKHASQFSLVKEPL